MTDTACFFFGNKIKITPRNETDVKMLTFSGFSNKNNLNVLSSQEIKATKTGNSILDLCTFLAANKMPDANFKVIKRKDRSLNRTYHDCKLIVSFPAKQTFAILILSFIFFF